MSDTATLTHAGGHDAHDHAHEPHLQHHFADYGQQFDASKIGMWLFLATEILMFGGLFAGYGLQQAKFHEAFRSAHHHLDKSLGLINTVALLTSSFTMVLAVWAAKTNRRRLLIGNLITTIALAGLFMVIKLALEYPHKIHEGLLPGGSYFYKGPHLEGENIFFSFYFMMTGLHGFHVLVGMGLLTYLTVRAIKGDYSSKWYTPVDLVGLYWHLVDMIWIYLFPLMYLVS